MDALIGAACLGDLGKLFPDNDPQYKNISSVILLEKVGAELKKAGYKIENIDATVVAQKPKLAAFIPEMVTNIEKTLGLPMGSVNVKATTEEGLGFTGSGEGIAAHAVCLLV
ncbi:MAG: 2-C-methyl-D-erythritol 2,4-cyclodiphosphate synthase, partial [Eubacteriales bacterium]